MLTPETRLKDRYRILEKIGGGGFGYVYKAIDEAFGCCVAVKETREEVAGVEKMRKAFEREAKLLRNLKHECLPRVTDYFFATSAQFLVMDFIEGEDLAALLRRRLERQSLFTLGEVLPWADKILGALEYLHGRPEPIVHRDIKPANIKLADDGGIYLLDFGLAKGATGQMSTMLEGQSSFSVAAFTHEYAPLEQLQNTGTQPQSDIYSFGATLYHLLTGQFPLSASRRDEAVQRGPGDPLRPAHEVNAAIPLAVSRVISQAMAIRWWDRTASAKDMRAALARAAAEQVGAQSKLVLESKAISQSLSLVEHEGLSTLPLPQEPEPALPADASRALSGSVPARTNRFRSSWRTAAIVLVLLAAGAVALRLVFPAWFGSAVPTKPDAQATPSPEQIRAPTQTSSGLHLALSLPGHSQTVWCVAFSPDGSQAATAGDDSTILLWDTKTWKSEALLGHDGPVYMVAFSPDGKFLVSGGRDRTIRLWSTQRDEPSREPKWIQKLPKSVLNLAFSKDHSAGNVLASVSGEAEKGGEEIRLWYERNDWQPRVLPFRDTSGEGYKNKIFAMEFSADGGTLATAGYGRAIRLWNLKSEEQNESLSIEQQANGYVGRLAFSPDGKYLACGSQGGTVKLWRRTEKWEGPEEIPTEQTDVIDAVAFSPDNTTLASSSRDKTLILWNLQAKTRSRLTPGSGKSLEEQQSLAFSPDGQTLLTVGNDKMLNVWRSSKVTR